LFAEPDISDGRPKLGVPLNQDGAVNKDLPVAAPLDGTDEDDQVAAIARLRDLFSAGELSLERFSGVLEQVFAAPSYADLEAVMMTLPPLVRFTLASRRLAKPLVLQAVGSEHLTARDAERQAVPDLAGSTCHGDAQGRSGHGFQPSSQTYTSLITSTTLR
jgi:hypothetical protein